MLLANMERHGINFLMIKVLGFQHLTFDFFPLQLNSHTSFTIRSIQLKRTHSLSLRLWNLRPYQNSIRKPQDIQQRIRLTSTVKLQAFAGHLYSWRRMTRWTWRRHPRLLTSSASIKFSRVTMVKDSKEIGSIGQVNYWICIIWSILVSFQFNIQSNFLVRCPLHLQVSAEKCWIETNNSEQMYVILVLNNSIQIISNQIYVHFSNCK